MTLKNINTLSYFIWNKLKSIKVVKSRDMKMDGLKGWWWGHWNWRELAIRVSQICIKSEFQNEPLSKMFSIGPLRSVYKAFIKNTMFSPSSGFLIVLHPPSGDDYFFVDYPPLSYIKSCVLACRLRIWTSYLVLPKQNIELKPHNWQNLTILHKSTLFACFSAIIQYFA